MIFNAIFIKYSLLGGILIQFCTFTISKSPMMTSLDTIQIHFNDDNILLLNICLGFLMFGVALDMKWSDFRYVLDAPKAIITGMISQWILLPLFTILLIYVMRPEYALAMGMALIAACPGGNVSNYAVHLSRSNTALSIVMTSISTLLCVFTTPMIFRIVRQLLPVDATQNINFEIDFMSMVSVIVQLIIIPIAIGFFFNNYFPKLVDKIKKSVQKLSFVIFIGFVIFAIMGNRENLVNYIQIVFFIVLIHNALALFIGYGWSKWIVGLSTSDSRSISIETGIQNSGLALILVFNFFDGNGGMALIAAWWSIWHLISAMSVALYWRTNGFKLIKSQSPG